MEKNDRHVLLGGIDLGGTSIKVAVAKATDDEEHPYEIIKKESIETTTVPDDTMKKVTEFFLENGPIGKLGIASFGPLCLDRFSKNYGCIMNTPKEKWIKYNIIKGLLKNWKGDTPKIALDTDVNAPAKFEFKKGGHKANKNISYITVGTGVGVGFYINGETVTGLTHPEGGHVIIAPHPEEIEGFDRGVCIYHPHCVEGYTTNVSIAKRYGISVDELKDLKDDDKVWDLVAYYLAVLCMNITLISSPEVIVMGGGVMNREILFPKIHKEFLKLMNNYILHDKLSEDQIHTYIVKSKFGYDSGLLSALATAEAS